MQLFCNTLAKAWVSERGPPETHILSHWVKEKEKRKRKETLPYLICNNSYSCEFLGLDHHVLSLAGFVDTVKSRIIVLMCYVVENSLPRKRGENRSEKGAAQPLWES